ncbi:MAG: hypothetical protein JSR29_20030 [Nitrospira sp.]|nr:hypothetical protein [Nitrospira sp.]
MNRSMIETRLSTLSDEFASGQRLLAEYDSKICAVREQLLRINGAMRVLQELLGQEAGSSPAATQSLGTPP